MFKRLFFLDFFFIWLNIKKIISMIECIWATRECFFIFFFFLFDYYYFFFVKKKLTWPTHIQQHRIRRWRLNVHATHAVHRRPVDPLEATHVNAGKAVSRVRSLRGRGGCGNRLRGGCCWLRGRSCGHRHWIRGVTVAGQTRVRGEQLIIVMRGHRGRGSLSLRLGLSLGLLHGRQLMAGLWHRGGGHADAERPAD